MSYKLIRILVCDIEECDFPDAPYQVQGDDDKPLADGWVQIDVPQTVSGLVKRMHVCPSCARAGKTVMQCA